MISKHGRKILLFSSLLLSSLQLPATLETGWRAAQSDYRWSFPEDHWAHPGYKTEWWYFTGHLHSRENTERQFGYQFTFFRIGLGTELPPLKSGWATRNLIMGHASISDLTERRHVFSEILYRAIPLLAQVTDYPESVIAWSLAPAGTDARWTLSWNGQAFDFEMQDDTQDTAFRLSTRPLKPLIFQGPNGFSRKGYQPTAASQYYSFTRLETEGTLMINGRRYQVEGESWMDKEFGSNQLAEHQVGWDWFSLQLEDGREIMLYYVRDRLGNIDFARGTVVDPTGDARYLARHEWTTKVISSWTSQETGTQYPSGWIISLPSEDLELEILPRLQDQENRSRILPALYYWEGAAEIRNRKGRTVGRGYVELTGYGEESRPPV